MARPKGAKNKNSVKVTGEKPLVTKNRIETSTIVFSKEQVERVVTSKAKTFSGYNSDMAFEYEEVIFHKNGSMTVIITNPKGFGVVPNLASVTKEVISKELQHKSETESSKSSV